jgi:hypothetical protein
MAVAARKPLNSKELPRKAHGFPVRLGLENQPVPAWVVWKSARALADGALQ